MFRLSVLLSACLFVTLLIAGADKGQMRPGLERAMAAGTGITMIERDFAETRSAPAAARPDRSSALPDAFVTDPLPDPMRPTAPVAAVIPAAASAEDSPQEPAVFTLSALPGVGQDETIPLALNDASASADVLSADAPIADPLPAGIDGLPATVWYVNTQALNVRQGPSSRDTVIDRLVNGEAVTVLGDPTSEWVRITIEGDGVEGWVASRLLSPY